MEEEGAGAAAGDGDGCGGGRGGGGSCNDDGGGGGGGGGGGEAATSAVWVDVFNPDDVSCVSVYRRDDVLRALVRMDGECFPDPRHRTLAALQNSQQLRRGRPLAPHLTRNSSE